MTAPLTAVMKALDGVRAAFYCDLAWASRLRRAHAPARVVAGTGGTGMGAARRRPSAQLVLALRLAICSSVGTRIALATLLRLHPVRGDRLAPRVVCSVRAHAMLVLPGGRARAVWIFVCCWRARLRILTGRGARSRPRCARAARGSAGC